MTKSRGLGRGLSALIGDSQLASLSGDNGVRKVPTSNLRPGRLQPRTHFNVEDIQSLAESIRRQGMLQPILARPVISDSKKELEIVAGERRWRAAQLAQLHEIPVVVLQISDTEAIQIALIENLQRENLRPLEEAGAYKHLHSDLGFSNAQIGDAVGKSRSYISNMLRLMELPESIQAMLDDRRITTGHARALLGATSPEKLAKIVVDRDLSVRATEALVRGETGEPSARTKKSIRQRTNGTATSPELEAVVHRLSEHLGLKVVLTGSSKHGRLIFYYENFGQLDDVIKRFERSDLPVKSILGPTETSNDRARGDDLAD